jgi:membrane associated rhomboid family serine protease
MIPLYDIKRSKKIPFITILLILINIVLFFLLYKDLGDLIYDYGFIPGDFNFIALFTSMFLHVSLFHVIGNMWFLWVFGDSIEGKIGHLKFLFLYIFSGVCSSVFYFLFSEYDILTPVIGASGAISGIVGAYLILFPKNKLRVFPCFTLLSIIYIVLWFLFQLFFAFIGNSETAYLGHVGGFLGGILFVLINKYAVKSK